MLVSSTHVFTMMVKYSFLFLLVAVEQQLNHPDLGKPVVGQVL